MTVTPFLLVPGAWALKPFHPFYSWWRESVWLAWMAERHYVTPDERDPFLWSTDLTMEAWRAGGAALKWYAQAKLPVGEPVRVIAHSHGWQPVLWAAALGLQIDVAMSFGAPQRGDMDDVFALARPNIRKWLHVRSQEWDIFEWLGNMGDGDPKLSWREPVGYDALDIVPGVGHSRVFFDPNWFVLWETRKWLEMLREWR